MRHELAVASAQVKSCILLAGLRAEGETQVAEPAASRDHTERMIRYAGGRAEREGPPDGPGTVRLWPVERLKMHSLTVPGDFSSAAFFIVGALLIQDSLVTIENAGLNPTRTGLLNVLKRMGAAIDVESTEVSGPEPVGRITSRTSRLLATEIRGDEVANVIDELPLFLLAAAKAKGISRLRGAAELRAKESDRLQAMSRLLRALGVEVVEYADGMDVVGDPNGWGGGTIATEGDHRGAMAGAIAGAASKHGTTIDDASCIAVSYPGFVRDLEALGGR
jgi:3-phosphoshikimate 1-carboxyvinyltransferase